MLRFWQCRQSRASQSHRIFPVNREFTGKNVRFGSILAIFWWFGSESYHNNRALQAVSLLIKEQGKLILEQGKKTKEKGSLISSRKHDFPIDKIDRREVHLHQLQLLMKCAANGSLKPIADLSNQRDIRLLYEMPSSSACAKNSASNGERLFMSKMSD